QQAKALGDSLKDTRVDSIFCSDLLRALWTAQQIQKHQPEKPSLTITELLREQHWGEAEHKPWGEGGYTREPGRHFKFPGGESLTDVRHRAKQAIADFIEPILQTNHGRPASSKHIVVVAHGIFNSEFIGALLSRRKGQGSFDWGYRGMTNTGWTKLEVGYADESPDSLPQHMETHPRTPISPSSEPSEPPPAHDRGELPPLSVKIVCTDITTHLDNVQRPPGGLGRQGYDEKQADIRKFFSGGD
ncbi:hypothetical protein TREMEDRAFT_33028, partial [Tremella mesenterica DSM 1558]|uniref:uncharacterized protein n=1 Tax=Tremella mesenterica (strain ATCC 24925 / CBS 8224 / DSM 1558 / NBRC 9311 / NRRL Y-6157 / RJB 2259-6 / UBC 559-6) TaxID=578456 RepID=UPI0003F490DF